MKKFFILLNVLVFIFLIIPPLCNAEKIYYKDGEIVYGKILYRSKGSVWIKHKLGSIGIDLQSIDRIENDDGSISKYDYESLVNMIQNYIRQKKYNKAVELCSLLLESFPDSAQIRYLRSSLNQKIGNFEQAIEDYNFLIKHEVADAKILNNLGAIYANDKEYREAMDLFIMATGDNPDIVEAHNNLAELLLQTKDYNRAIDEYKKVIDIEPDNVITLHNLGIAYMNIGDYKKAEEQWKKIIAIRPHDGDAKNG